MRAVGIRELKNRLSEYLRLVGNGENIQVTDRGRVVAEIHPPGQTSSVSANPKLDELVRQGKIRLPSRPNDPSLYVRFKPLRKPVNVKRLLDWTRGDR